MIRGSRIHRRPHQVAAAVLVTGVLVLGLGVSGASARGYGSLGTMTPENTFIEKDFQPMVGNYPGREANFFAYYRPPACRTATYCDAFHIDVDYSDDYLRNTFFSIRVTLTWPNPQTEENDGGNDLDLFLWGDDGEAAGAPASKCRSPEAEDCEFLEKEVVVVTEPSRSVGEGDDVEDPLFFTVVNHKGVNDGYHITAEWNEFDIPEPEGFEPPERAVSGGASGADQGPSTDDTTDPTPTPDLGSKTEGPDEEQRTVLVPGPDGELVERELPVLAAGEGLERREAGGINPFIPAGIVAGLIGIGTAILILRRHREEREAEGF